MHADADREPWIGSFAVAGRAQELEPGLDRAPPEVGTGKAGNINSDHLVARHLVHHSVAAKECLRGGLKKALHKGGEFGRAHAGGHLGRAAHVGIEHRDVDLGAAAVLPQDLFALLAEMRIALPRPAPHYAHERGGEAVESRQADAAAIMRRRREHAEKMPAALHGLELTRQHRVPEGIDLAGFIDWIGHAPNLRVGG